MVIKRGKKRGDSSWIPILHVRNGDGARVQNQWQIIRQRANQTKKKEVGKTKFQIKLINRKLIGSHANVQRSTGCHAHARGRWVAHRVGKSDWMDPHRSQLELTNGFSIRRQVLFDSFNSIREAWVQKRGSEMGAEWGG